MLQPCCTTNATSVRPIRALSARGPRRIKVARRPSGKWQNWGVGSVLVHGQCDTARRSQLSIKKSDPSSRGHRPRTPTPAVKSIFTHHQTLPSASTCQHPSPSVAIRHHLLLSPPANVRHSPVLRELLPIALAARDGTAPGPSCLRVKVDCRARPVCTRKSP